MEEDKSKLVLCHLHGSNSALDGLSNLKEAALKLKELGYGGGAITDHGTLSGTYDWYKACNEVGIKPILGCEFYMAINDYKIHDNSEKERTHLTVLAKNKKGWQNLCRLNYLSYKDGFYYKNRIDYKLLFEHKEGLIVLSGCASSQISKYIKNDEFDKAKDLIIKLKEEFKDDFYLELQSHDWEPQKKINKFLRQMSKELDIKTLVGADSHYVNHSDQYEHEIVLCIGTASNINDKDRMTLKDFDLSIPDPKDLEKEFSLELENSKEIYDKCNFDFKELFDGHVILPDFTDKDKEYDLLRRLVFEGYKKKYTGNETWKGETIQQRIHRELETIKKIDYVGYLLIVSDICRWCKKNDILVGPGRGSVGGSVVAYCLDITSFSPLIEDIVFERFVNEDRYCFVPNSVVNCKHSARVKIKDIKPGDEVKTFDLTYQKVLRKHIKYVEDENMIRLFLSNGKKIECTENHGIFVKDKGFISAKNLKETDILLSPKTGTDIVEVKCNRCNNFVKVQASEYTSIVSGNSSKEITCKKCTKIKKNETIINRFGSEYNYYSYMSRCRTKDGNNKISEAAKRRWKDKNFREYYKNNQNYKFKTTEFKEKCRQASIDFYSNKDNYKKYCSLMKEVNNRPEKIEKQRKSILETINTKGLNNFSEKSYRTVAAHFASQKNNSYIYCRSSYERLYCELLEVDSTVLSFCNSSHRIKYIDENGKERIYLPDFDVYYNNGKVELVEIKNKYTGAMIRNKLKIQAAKKYCKENNIDFIYLDCIEKIKEKNSNLHNDIKIMKIEKFKYTGEVYDLTIENNQNYFVSNICVHNSPCDIDLDFQEDKRHLVIEYITKRYGEEFVSGIGIYSKLKAKSAFKDVARTLGMSFEDSLKATKEIYENPLNVDKYLMVSLKGDGDKILPSQYVVEQYNNNPLFKEVFDEAVKLEGKLRQIGTHACGKLISPINLTWNIPLMVSNGDVITQWDHPTIESLVGVQKFDILGLSNLKIAKNTIKNIRFNL